MWQGLTTWRTHWYNEKQTAIILTANKRDFKMVFDQKIRNLGDESFRLTVLDNRTKKHHTSVVAKQSGFLCLKLTCA